MKEAWSRARENPTEAMEAVLALFGHSDSEEDRRVGALLVADFLVGFTRRAAQRRKS